MQRTREFRILRRARREMLDVDELMLVIFRGLEGGEKEGWRQSEN